MVVTVGGALLAAVVALMMPARSSGYRGQRVMAYETWQGAMGRADVEMVTVVAISEPRGLPADCQADEYRAACDAVRAVTEARLASLWGTVGPVSEHHAGVWVAASLAGRGHAYSAREVKAALAAPISDGDRLLSVTPSVTCSVAVGGRTLREMVSDALCRVTAQGPVGHRPSTRGTAPKRRPARRVVTA